MTFLVLLATAKLLVTGWDLSSLRYEEVLAHADELASLPFDGAILTTWDVACADGRTSGAYSQIMTDPAWDRAALLSRAPTLRALKRYRPFGEIFLGARLSPRRRLAWTDDAAWANAAANYATLAALVREGGARGLSLDPEDYAQACQYLRQPGDPPPAELARLARARAREVFGAVFRECPNITLLATWYFTFTETYFASGAVAESVCRTEDLWPAFVNGILDALPPTARLVDGDERAYRYSAGNRDFETAASQQRIAALTLVAPENRVKYATQVLTGFGIYGDMYTNKEGGNWYLGPVGGSRVRHLALNVDRALDVADGYVWFYGQTYSWRDYGTNTINRNSHFRRHEYWKDALPGVETLLALAKDPSAFLRAHPDCAAASPNLTTMKPATWQTAYRFDPNGRTGVFDRVALTMTGVPSGCFMFPVRNVTPGEAYRVSVRIRGERASAAVRWQKDGKWTKLSAVILPMGAADAEGWRRAETAVLVPDGANILNFSVNALQNAGERIELADPAVRFIPIP